MQPEEQHVYVNDIDGKSRRATLLTCCVCRSQEWLCFIVDGHEHSHFQCIGCGTSYCPDGQCGETTAIGDTATRWTIPEAIMEGA